MRSIILVQIASTLLIGAARASPINDHATEALELNSPVHTEICEHNDNHLQKRCIKNDHATEALESNSPVHTEICEHNDDHLQKRCIKNDCPPNHLHHAGKCHQDKQYFKQTIEYKHHKDTSYKKEHSNKYHSDDSDDDDDDESEKEKKSKKNKKDKKKSHGESKHPAKDDGEFRGYRCGSELYIKPTIESAAKKGCELKKNKQKKAGYPEMYLPSSGDEEKKLEVFNPTKKHFVYPIYQDPLYKFSLQPSSFALFDEDCKVNGAVVKKKTNPCPADKWCFAQMFQKSNFHYVSCDLDYRQSY